MSNKIWCKDTELLKYFIPEMEFVTGVFQSHENVRKAS